MKRTLSITAALLILAICTSGCGSAESRPDMTFLSEDNSAGYKTETDVPDRPEAEEAAAEPLTQSDTAEACSVAEEEKDRKPETGTGTQPGPENRTEPAQHTAEVIQETEVTARETFGVPAEHEHQWADEIAAHHDAVTHTEHHEAETEQVWVSVPVETQRFYCDVCNLEFTTQADAYAHEDATYRAAVEANDMSLIHAGHYSIEEITDEGYYETVIVREAYDETVVDVPAWDEHVFRCTVCGETGSITHD